MSFGVGFRGGNIVTLPLSEGAGGLIIWCTDMIAMYEAPRTEYRCSVALAFPPETPMEAIFAVSPRGVTEVTGQCRIYDGTQTEPDPLIKQEIGDDAPAYKGVIYIVFEDFLLTPFDNFIPDIYAGKREAGHRP